MRLSRGGGPPRGQVPGAIMHGWSCIVCQRCCIPCMC